MLLHSVSVLSSITETSIVSLNIIFTQVFKVLYIDHHRVDDLMDFQALLVACRNVGGAFTTIVMHLA
ncbi:MAG: hypothetical protein ABI479_11855 [Gallionella sp.]